MSTTDPEDGDMSIDATGLPFAVALDDDEKKGLLGAQPGIEEVMAETIANQPLHGGAAGVTDVDYARIMESNGRIETCERFLSAVRRMLQNLLGGRAVAVDTRERLVFAIAESVVRRAKPPGNDGLAGRSPATRDYRAADGQRGGKSRP